MNKINGSISLCLFLVSVTICLTACSSEYRGKVNVKPQSKVSTVKEEAGSTVKRKDSTAKQADFSEAVSQKYMLDVIEQISKEPRAVDTEGIDSVLKYLESQLSETDYIIDQQTFYYTDELNAEAIGSRNNLDIYLKGAFTNNEADKKGINLLAKKNSDSQNKTLIISAHYDTGNESVGANDNGSGVAVLLQAAKILSSMELPYNLEFVFFSGEESWFLGSRYYVAALSEDEKDNIIGVINVDTVAEKSDLGYWVMVGDGEESTDENGEPIFQPVENNMSKLFTSKERFDIVCQMNSDHYPFSQAGIPAISIVQDMSNELKANSSDDTKEIIDEKRLGEIASVLLESVGNLSKQFNY